ncbi:MAG: two-component response regulator MtrA [Actinomycetota bacterium]
MSIRLLLVEDDDAIRRVLVEALKDGGYTVAEAPTGEQALAYEGIADLDLAVVDLRLPGINGIDVVRELRKRTDAPIVILTAHGGADDVVVGLEAGADDFLNKPISSRELLARLSAILRRASTSEVAESSREVVVGSLRFLRAQHEATINGAKMQLTRTEFGVLCLLAERSPNTVTRQELLANVWGYDYLGDSRLVDMQIYRLRQKLESENVKDKLLTLRGVGFKLVP